MWKSRTPKKLPLLLIAGLASAITMAQGGAPANDLCTAVTPQALAVGGSLTFTGDNSNATFPGDAAPGTVMAQYPAPNTWHAFTTTTCSNVTVSYCGTAAGWSNVWRLLSTDCPADSLIGASVSDTTTCANHNWTFTFNNLAAGTYYLPVPNFGFGQGGGAYSIAVSAVACANSNDHCTSVVPQALAVGTSLTFTGDNSTATFDGDAVPGTIMAQYPAPNTWHAFTTTTCSNVTVSYCGTNSGWSNVWKLLAVECPADSTIGASVSDTTTCANGNWTFTFNSLAAGTYYLPVPNFGFGQGGGAYSIQASATDCAGVPPANDLCSNVVPQALSVGSTLTFTGNNTNATFTGDAAPGTVLAQYPAPNTWHAFTTTTCSNVTVSYCGTDSGWSNVWKLLAVECPADSTIGASVSDTTTCANGNWTFTFNSLAAGTYYLPVPNFGFGQGGGMYSIQVSAADCVGLPPANDLCSNVVPQSLSVGNTLTFTGNNTYATFTGDAAPGTVLAQYPAPNTWHAFTTTMCSNVTVSYCGTDSGWSNVWKLLAVECPADSTIAASVSDTTTCANGNWTFTFNSLAAGTYYLPVPNFGFGQGGGAYSIALSASYCAGDPPVNDLCSSVTPQALTIGSSLTFTGDNSTATFTGDAVAGTIMAQFPFPNTWHAFTTTACSDVTVSYCATDSGWSNVWRLLSTDCPADSLINASNADTTACANGNWTFSFLALAPGTYYLPVPNVGFGQGGGLYSIGVSASICTVGLPDHMAIANWTLYPNPANGSVTVAFPSDLGHAKLELMDMTGRVLISEQISTSGNALLDLDGKLATGQYLVQITTATSRSIQRLILR
jgi:hypothetical protein